MSKRRKVLIVIGLLLLGIQFVPVPRENPPVAAAITPPDEVQVLLEGSCFDCHSNQPGGTRLVVDLPGRQEGQERTQLLRVGRVYRSPSRPQARGARGESGRRRDALEVLSPASPRSSALRSRATDTDRLGEGRARGAGIGGRGVTAGAPAYSRLEASFASTLNGPAPQAAKKRKMKQKSIASSPPFSHHQGSLAPKWIQK